MATQGVAEFIG